MKNLRDTAVRLMKLKRVWILLLFPLALLLLAVAKRSVYFTEEIFAKGIFHIYSQVFSFVTGLVPFSLAEMGIVLGIVGIPAVIIWRIIIYIKGKGERGYLITADLLSLLCLGALVYFMLVMGCSVNYYRKPVADYLGLTVRDSSVEELYNLHAELAERTSAVREQLTLEDADGVYRLSVSKAELAKWCDDTYDVLAKEHAVFHGVYPKPK